MPRNALRCLVEIGVQSVTSPGTWLGPLEGVHIAVQLFGQVRHTRTVEAAFPLRFNDHLKFDKVFPFSHRDPLKIIDSLQDVGIRIELLQVLPGYKEGQVLAWYESSAKNFLYPYPSNTSSLSYGTHDREIMLERSLAFPGISPRMDFSTKTLIQETMMPNIERFSDSDSVSSDTAYYNHRPHSSRSKSPSRYESNICRCMPGMSRPLTSSYAGPVVSPRHRSKSPHLHHRVSDMSMSDDGYQTERSGFYNKYGSENIERHSRSRQHSGTITCPICHCSTRSGGTMPRTRSRSASPSPRLQNRIIESYSDDNSDTAALFGDRPPFHVRKVDKNLTGRYPSPLAARLWSPDSEAEEIDYNLNYGSDIDGLKNPRFSGYSYPKYRSSSKGRYNDQLYTGTGRSAYGDDYYGREERRSGSVSPSRPPFRTLEAACHRDCHRTPGTGGYIGDMTYSDWAVRRRRSLERRSGSGTPRQQAAYLW